MATSVGDVELSLEGLVSLASKGLQQIQLKDIYHVMKELGVGGYASVFMVKDRKTDVRMALKVLDRKKTTERNFLMEFSISFLLSPHPNIIGSYGIAFKTQEHFAFAQELSPVGDLFSLIRPHTGLQEDTVKRCAAQISSALEFIDSKGLVHLDIKPENVLVFDQDCHCIKLTDFGLARVKGKVIHSRLGSISYMAPEMCQLADKDSLLADSTLDVWAFGVVLYCLLTGEFPWQMALPTDKAYSRFAEWQTHTPSDDPPSPWDRLPAGVLRMFCNLLAIDCTKRSKATEVLVFMDESWRAERIYDNMDDAKGTCPVEAELSSVHQTSSSSNEMSNTVTDTSHSCESILSGISSMSCHLSSSSSGSHCEEAPDPRQEHALNPVMLMEDDVFLHVGAEVEIG